MVLCRAALGAGAWQMLFPAVSTQELNSMSLSPSLGRQRRRGPVPSRWEASNILFFPFAPHLSFTGLLFCFSCTVSLVGNL